MFRLERDGAAARLVLDRPKARNAIPAAAWRDLAAAVAEAADARLLVLSGTPPAFCAGADLADFARFRDDAAARTAFRLDMRAALDALAEAPMPTLARIEGACFGAGVALAMACDLRIAAPAATFAITPAKFGISYPQEDVHRLVELVGPGQAARLLLGAAPIDAAEAARIGLVELVGDASMAAEAERAILANEPESLKVLKRAVRLAAAGRRSDAGQDSAFDSMMGGETLARRLAALRPK